jgi:hypothetical protein
VVLRGELLLDDVLPVYDDRLPSLRERGLKLVSFALNVQSLKLLTARNVPHQKFYKVPPLTI